VDLTGSTTERLGGEGLFSCLMHQDVVHLPRDEMMGGECDGVPHHLSTVEFLLYLCPYFVCCDLLQWERARKSRGLRLPFGSFDWEPVRL
jgi:hypothetical protein